MDGDADKWKKKFDELQKDGTVLIKQRDCWFVPGLLFTGTQLVEALVLGVRVVVEEEVDELKVPLEAMGRRCWVRSNGKGVVRNAALALLGLSPIILLPALPMLMLSISSPMFGRDKKDYDGVPQCVGEDKG
ncbi:hypothetical protein C0991_010487, partial [Blastosporella zonata]